MGRGRRRGRGEAGGRRQSSRGGTAALPGQVALDEAATLLDRASRRTGQESISLLSMTVAKVGEALSLGVPQPAQVEAHITKAEALSKWAETVLEVCRTLPDDQLSPQLERAAAEEAGRRHREAADAFQEGLTACNRQRVDALVDFANMLTSRAELEEAGQLRAEYLNAAGTHYREALALQEDAATWTNYGDCLVQLAQHLSCQSPELAQIGIAEADKAFLTACGLTDSEQGDDLPGLLCNWGAGLLSVAGLATVPPTPRSPANPPPPLEVLRTSQDLGSEASRLKCLRKQKEANADALQT